MPRPAGLCWKKPHAEPHCWHGRVDESNLTKVLEDCLTGIVWRDDRQVVGGVRWRRYARIGEQAGARVTIYNLGEWQEEPKTEIPEAIVVQPHDLGL
jgi:hypothetical protein